jgi:hypothetical protein
MKQRSQMRTKFKSLLVIAATIFSLNINTVPTTALDLGAKATYIITINPAARSAIEAAVTRKVLKRPLRRMVGT